MAHGSGGKAMAAGKLIVGWVALLWVLEVVDQASGNALDTFGVEPRRVDELVDVIPAPSCTSASST